jgi:hypothetical protein
MKSVSGPLPFWECSRMEVFMRTRKVFCHLMTDISGIWLMLMFAFILTGVSSTAQSTNDTLYFSPIKQWTVKYYLITDTVSGAHFKVSTEPITVPLQIYLFDSLNCVLKVEAHQLFPFRNYITFIKPDTRDGEFLWIHIFDKKIDYDFRKRRWGKI